MTQKTDVEAARLTETMRAWAAVNPYSTLDVFLARPTREDAFERPLPGVCFNLNSTFMNHLRDLGVHCSIHLAGVQDHDSPDQVDVGSHIAVVSQLDGVPHLTDVGLGCGPLRPIPLREGLHDFNGFDFRLTAVDRGGQRWWRLDIPPALSRAFIAMEFQEHSDPAVALARANHFLSPTTSPLRDVLLIQGWVGDRLVTAHGRTMSVRSARGTEVREVYAEPDDWRTAVQAWFPEAFDDKDLAAAWARHGTVAH
jgi:arylamine N-acetyltransferase